MSSWDDLVEKYPDQWAFVKNVRRDDAGNIISFELLKVCPKSEKSKWLKLYMSGNEKFECIRTTFNAPNMGALL